MATKSSRVGPMHADGKRRCLNRVEFFDYTGVDGLDAELGEPRARLRRAPHAESAMSSFTVLSLSVPAGADPH